MDPVVYAGATLDFEYTDAGAAANATLAFLVRGEGIFRRVTGRRDGSTWTGTVAASATASWPDGAYEFQTCLKTGSRVDIVETGRFRVEKLAGTDHRHALKSFAEQALKCVEEVLLDYAADGAVSFSVGDQSYTFESRSELMAFRESLRAEVERDRSGRTGGGVRW